MINVNEYINELKSLVNSEDTELAHILADGVLCNLLKELGYHEVVRVYEEVDKWYS